MIINENQLKSFIFDCIKEYVDMGAIYLTQPPYPFIVTDQEVHNKLKNMYDN